MMMEGFQATAAEPSVAADQEFHPVAGLVEKSLIATRIDETQAQYRSPAGQRRTLGEFASDISRLASARWLPHPRKIFSSPLVSGNSQCSADVRYRTRAPSAVRIDVARRTIKLSS
jgi:hypothetical protein